MTWRACESCTEWLDANYGFSGICASVAIRHGMPSMHVREVFMTAYHDRGHVLAHMTGQPT